MELALYIRMSCSLNINHVYILPTSSDSTYLWCSSAAVGDVVMFIRTSCCDTRVDPLTYLHPDLVPYSVSSLQLYTSSTEICLDLGNMSSTTSICYHISIFMHVYCLTIVKAMGCNSGKCIVNINYVNVEYFSTCSVAIINLKAELTKTNRK